jgi:hypothetical protein
MFRSFAARVWFARVRDKAGRMSSASTLLEGGPFSGSAISGTRRRSRKGELGDIDEKSVGCDVSPLFEARSGS